MGENVASETSKCPFCGNEVNLFIFYKDKIVGCKYCGVNIKKRSNADRLRAMTDEELAILLSNTEANFPPNCQDGVSVKLCETAWLDWLRQESEDE